LPDYIIPIMTPNNPRALPKISIIKILTKVDGVYTSARAQPAPVTPTATPQNKFDRPTDIPAPKMQKQKNDNYNTIINLTIRMFYL
jgi:hypothetical protein